MVGPRLDVDVAGGALPCSVRAEVTWTRCGKRRCVLELGRPGRGAWDLAGSVCGLDDGASDDLRVGVVVDHLEVVAFDAERVAAVDRSNQKSPVDLVDRDPAAGHKATRRVGIAAISAPAEHEPILPGRRPNPRPPDPTASRSADPRSKAPCVRRLSGAFCAHDGGGGSS